MSINNMRTGWDTWLDIMRGRFFLSRGMPTSIRFKKSGDIKTYPAQVEQDGEFEQWDTKVYKDLIDHIDVAEGASIDPPEIGENLPELPSNMCAMHNASGGGIDGTEGIS